LDPLDILTLFYSGMRRRRTHDWKAALISFDFPSMASFCRRLAAVGTVQPEPTLQLGYPRGQSRDLRRLRCNQRKKVFPRRLDRRVPIHRILESETESAVY
jgi:hypothetical protein